MRKALPERRLLLLIGAVQFANVLDFMMVMPLGPDFARALGIPTSRLGLVGASYTAAAALTGLLGALVLDRFGRRNALAVALSGLVAGTAAGALATGLQSMLAARLLAGAFGGPVTSLSLAVVADVVPAERRGRAMGAVMGAFAVASVLGVPAGLELARAGGWRLPFLAVAAVEAALVAVVILWLPPLDRHLRVVPAEPEPAGALLRKRAVQLSLLAMAALMTAQFAIVPNIATYWQLNLGYPRDRLGLLFIAGGVAAFATMRVAGRLADRIGAAPAAAVATVVYVAVLLAAFVFPPSPAPALALFVAFMSVSAFRMVPVQALASRVPAPAERARYMSASSVVQHLGSACGALLSSRMLREAPGGALRGMGGVAALAAGLASMVPFVLWRVERRLRGRDRGRGGAVEPPSRVTPSGTGGAAA